MSQLDLFGNAPERRPFVAEGIIKVVRPAKLRGDEIFLTPKQLANKIGYHIQTVYGWKRKRGMPVNQATFHGSWTVEWHEFCKWWKEKKV